MKEAIKFILEGFDDDPKRAARDMIVVAVFCAIVVVFLVWTAAPIPTEIPEYRVMAETAGRVVR